MKTKGEEKVKDGGSTKTKRQEIKRPKKSRKKKKEIRLKQRRLTIDEKFNLTNYIRILLIQIKIFFFFYCFSEASFPFATIDICSHTPKIALLLTTNYSNSGNKKPTTSNKQLNNLKFQAIHSCKMLFISHHQKKKKFIATKLSRKKKTKKAEFRK